MPGTIRASTKELRTRIERRARRTGLRVTADLAEALGTYLELLFRWNERINLTAFSELDEAVDRLVLEPLAAARHLPRGDLSLMDIGSGGGSPAVPLKLAKPDVRLVMVESKTRKAAFLREVIRELSLDRSVVETARYEELLPRPDLHEAMDVVSIRAVRIESKVLMAMQAFLVQEGLLFLFRGPSGGDAPSELTPPLTWVATHPLVPSIRSRLVVIRKERVGRSLAGSAVR